MPLRAKLLLACVAVELLMLAVLLRTGLTVQQAQLVRQGEQQVAQFVAMADATLAGPLLQRDYASLQHTLDELQATKAINYLLIVDHLGRPVLSSGWPLHKPTPPADGKLADIDLERSDHVFHATHDLELLGQPLGRLHFGLSTEFLIDARAALIRESLPWVAAVVALTLLLLGLTTWALTRQLAALEVASARIAGGDYAVAVPIQARDEIGRVSMSFNAMAQAVRARVQDLEQAERRQSALTRSARDEHRRLQSLLDAMDHGILFLDPQQRVLYANRAFAQIWRLPDHNPLVGMDFHAVHSLLLPHITHGRSGFGELQSTTPWRGRAGGLELRTRDDRVVIQLEQEVEGDGGTPLGRLLIHDDATVERWNLERAQLAERDALTGTLNRRGMVDALAQALAAARQSQSPVALFFIDLDDFKYANDVYGHRAGDELLAGVARALGAELRRGELVGRIGGDEFAVLCPDTDASGAAAIAPRLVQAVSQFRLRYEEHELRVGCSVGIALFPEHAPNAEELLVRADAAMYAAKRAGKNGWALFSPQSRRVETENAHVLWNARVARALERGLLVLEYQGVHRTDDGRLSHHEALVRMVDENDRSRLLAPAEFIAVAERSGKVREIDRWVIENCVRTLSGLPRSVRIAANLSARTLDDPLLPEFVSHCLDRHDVSASRLAIELTETASSFDATTMRGLVASLRELGCAVHLDDFGSGFASFAQLRQLRVDAIKIDGSYIRGLHDNAENRVFVSAMVTVARGLGICVIAEHVEDAATLALLRTMGVDLAQGWHLGRPQRNLREPEDDTATPPRSNAFQPSTIL